MREQRARRAGADCGDRQARELARVTERREELLNAVRAGQAEQVVLRQIGQLRVQWLDLDRRCFDDLCAERAESRCQRTGLGARACYRDRLASKWPSAVTPADLLAERRDVADHRDRRRFDLSILGDLRDRFERADDLALSREGSSLDYCCGLVARATTADQSLRDPTKAAHAHVEDQRAGEGSQSRPVDLGLRLVGVLMASDEGDGARYAALRYRDAGVGRGCDSRSDSGDDLDRDPALQAGDRFLAAAPKDERVATLQSYDAAPGQGVLDDQLVRDLLRYLLAAADLADVDQLSVAAYAIQSAWAD
ncbi:unannotated protein [freshwater metagenome]|uniref:Unannotated protein n=1 Tax=freshwater metagenome TaxID=449393 RepID=A0A6J5ZFI9_9ZZZZ